VRQFPDQSPAPLPGPKSRGRLILARLDDAAGRL
jgi:hypothetical protein